MFNSLSQTLLKIVSPGVVDFYQGSELWDLRMVDPDNRGPIDFARRAAALDGIVKGESHGPGDRLAELVEHWRDGRIKMHLIWKAIRFRRECQNFFREAELLPLQCVGAHSCNVITFLWKHESSGVVVVIPRWISHLAAEPDGGPGRLDWKDTKILLPAESSAEWQNILTGKSVTSSQDQSERVLNVSDLLRDFPVALCHSGAIPS
jgi:(1->4)-alpha-D-glucan 1-alpha-D-glucosylmutase